MKLQDSQLSLKEIVHVVKLFLSLMMVKVTLMKLIIVKKMMVLKFYQSQKDTQKINKILL